MYGDDLRLSRRTPFFAGLLMSNEGTVPTTVSTYLRWRQRFADELNDVLQPLQSTIDHASQDIRRRCCDIERCERADETTSESGFRVFRPSFAFPTSHAEALLSYLFGRAIGRWGSSSGRVPILCDSAPSAAPASLPASEAGDSRRGCRPPSRHSISSSK